MLQDGNSKNFSFPAQLGIFLGLTGAGMVMASVSSAIIWLAMTHRSFATMQTDMTNPAFYNAMMVIQGVSTFFLFFLPVIFFALICYRKVSAFAGTLTRISYKQIIWVIIILLLVFPVGGMLGEINKVIPIPKSWAIKFQQMEDARKVEESIFININSFSRYLLSLFIIACLPAIFEEFFFRGGLQNIFTRWFKGPLIAIVLTSIIFSLVHMSYYGFLVRFFLGVILGTIFYLSSSIWLSVLLHFLFNGLQITAMYISQTSRTNSKELEENFPVWAGAFALILLIFAMIKFKKESLAVQEKFIYHEPDDDDFHNWLAKNN